jgi:hypothetical protein
MIGLDANPASIHFARAVGGALLGVAIMTWLARNSGPSQARNALVAGLTLFFLLEVVEYVRAMMIKPKKARRFVSRCRALPCRSLARLPNPRASGHGIE